MSTQLRSAFGAGSLDGAGAALESVELGAGAALESDDDGVLLDGVLDIEGDELCGVVLGSVVVAAGPAVGFCDCSVVGAPCVEVELLSLVCAYAKPIAPTIVAAATALVRVFEATVMSILLRVHRPWAFGWVGGRPRDDQLPLG